MTKEDLLEQELSAIKLSDADPQIKAAMTSFLAVGLSVQEALEKLPHIEVFNGPASLFVKLYPDFACLYSTSEVFSEPIDIIELAEVAGHVDEVTITKSEFLVIIEPKMVKWYRQTISRKAI
jgi:hypothetical protein